MQQKTQINYFALGNICRQPANSIPLTKLFANEKIICDNSGAMRKNKSKHKKANKKFAKRMTTLSAMVALATALVGAYVLGIQSLVRETVFYPVDAGASISAVAADMKGKNLIVYEALFKASVLLQGNRIQKGVYEFQPGVSIYRMAGMFNRGRVASITVLIPEGLTVRQVKNLLMENPVLTGDVECAAAPAGTRAEDISPACNLQEGDLFPDTYRVARGTGRLAVVELAARKMESIRMALDKAGKVIPAPLKSWNEVLTLASIVQKETPKTAEMPVVASVYLNRLKKNMRLQADPTVVYAITDRLGDMRGQALFSGHLKVQNPYNTYVNYGLPPAPIANVGRDAILAVLNPADTNYLFFVADGQGGHKFARSYEEHKKNQADWREIKKSLNSRKKTANDGPGQEKRQLLKI
jgi:UPF0755 protein